MTVETALERFRAAGLDVDADTCLRRIAGATGLAPVELVAGIRGDGPDPGRHDGS